jgi:hypothetical protein
LEGRNAVKVTFRYDSLAGLYKGVLPESGSPLSVCSQEVRKLLGVDSNPDTIEIEAVSAVLDAFPNPAWRTARTVQDGAGAPRFLMMGNHRWTNLYADTAECLHRMFGTEWFLFRITVPAEKEDIAGE